MYWIKKICMMLPMLPLVLSAQVNLIENGDFEHGLSEVRFSKYLRKDGKLKPAGDLIKLNLENDNVHSGKNAVCLISSDPAALIAMNSRKIKIKHGQHYCFSAWYYLQGKIEEENKITARIFFGSEENKSQNPYIFPAFELRSGEWTKVKYKFYPPVDASDVSVTLWFNGTGSIIFDDFELHEISDAAVLNLWKHDFTLYQTSELTIWKAAPYQKICREKLPEKLSPGFIEITCARNESEPFQLILHPVEDLKKVNLKFSDLKDEKGNLINSSNLTYSPIGFVHLQDASIPSLIGWNADPMLREQVIDCPSGLNQPFWVNVKVPKSSLPGLYCGNIQVITDGKALASLPLKVSVRNFFLPDIPYLITAFNTSTNNLMKQWDTRSEAAQSKDLAEQLQKHRITGNQGDIPPTPNWKIDNGKLTIIDWNKFDKFVENRIKHYDIRWFRAPMLGIFGDNDGLYSYQRKIFGVDIRTSEAMKYLEEYSKELASHLKEKNWLPYFYSRLWDEPSNSEVFILCEQIASAIKRGAPELKIMITTKVNPKIKFIDAWCIPFAPGYYNQEYQECEIKKGKEIWFYNWLTPLDTADYIKNRLFAWQVYLGNGKGGYKWTTVQTYKGINPWKELNKTLGNGGATLFYPPCYPGDKYYSSQRLAQVKEAIDDFDYMNILEEKINAVYPAYGRKRVEEIIGQLIYETPFNYINDPSLLYFLRDKIGDEIENFDRSPQCIVSTEPKDNISTYVNKINFSVFCPPGSTVKINDDSEKVTPDGKLESMFILPRLGDNEIKITVSHQGKTKIFHRHFKLEKDPDLMVLKNLIDKAASDMDVSQYTIFLKGLTEKCIYDHKEHANVIKAIGELNKLFLGKKLQQVTSQNALHEMIIKQAKKMFALEFYDRVEYYLQIAKTVKKLPSQVNSPVQIIPIEIDGAPAFRLKNSQIEVTILEAGGRILDFKVNGVSCFRQTGQKGYSESNRIAGRKKDFIFKYISLGGYEDAESQQVLYAGVDWDISFPQISPNCITIRAELLIPEKRFHISREMTINAGIPVLQIKYVVKNITSLQSDGNNPVLNYFNWRGSTMMALGGNTDNDSIVIPTMEKLPAELFINDSGTFYSRSLELTNPYAGVFDTKLGIGFAHVIDPAIKNLYIWFDSRKGKNCYTIEPHRSHIPMYSETQMMVKPFEIAAGNSIAFTNYMVGIANIKTSDEFKKVLLEFIKKINIKE